MTSSDRVFLRGLWIGFAAGFTTAALLWAIGTFSGQ